MLTAQGVKILNLKFKKMLNTIKGDLIKLAEGGMFDIIIQGCNCFHTQSSGLAKQLATKYPQVLEVDKITEYGDLNKLGSYSFVKIELTNNIRFLVINAYTQYKWSSGSDVFEYDAFQRFLNNFAIEFKELNFVLGHKYQTYNIGFPQIGAGLAGGDWSRISKMIEKFSEDVTSHADVTVVEYQS
jgi:O-acetyl-ADP-ribose deacetylase (regulator of RNase III)